jgi:hypothetical protein
MPRKPIFLPDPFGAVLFVKPREPSNQTVERTATRLVSTLSVGTMSSMFSTHVPGRRRSSYFVRRINWKGLREQLTK